MFLYEKFKKNLKEKNVIIDSNIEFKNFAYLNKHQSKMTSFYRSRDTDYERINRNKKDVGNRGEKAILQYEINRLKKLGLKDLANKVCICENDAVGYDIISYDETGKEIHIEVKTNTTNKSYLDFYITSNELKKFINDEYYFIYYLYDINNKPKCHIIDKEMLLKNDGELLEPVIYKVNIDVEERK